MFLEILIAAFVVLYISLYLRILPDKINCYWFAATIASGFLWFFVVAYPLFILNKFDMMSKKDMNKYSAWLGSIMMWTVRNLNPQLRVIRDYSKMKWNEVPSNAHILFNHMSFWDSLNYTAEAPFSVCYTKKTLMKASLSKMPVAGTLIFKIMGHFPVYFASEKAEEFGQELEAKFSKDPDFLFIMGSMYYMLNEEEKTLHYLDRVLEMNPYDVESLSLKLRVYQFRAENQEDQELKQNELNVVIDCCRKILDETPDNFQVRDLITELESQS